MTNELPKRKTIRLQEYSYTQNGAYFITICTQNKARLFGKVVVGADLVSARMELNNAGKMIENVFIETVHTFGFTATKYIVMPNHFHCIIHIDPTQSRADTRSAPTGIQELIRAFKSKTTVEYIKGVKDGIYPPFDKHLWQRSYYDHVIRNERDYLDIWNYIDGNAAKWVDDKYYTP